MITSIVLLIIVIIFTAETLALRKRIKELENVVYYQMDATHYPAIQHEIHSIWREIRQLKGLDPEEE